MRGARSSREPSLRLSRGANKYFSAHCCQVYAAASPSPPTLLAAPSPARPRLRAALACPPPCSGASLRGGPARPTSHWAPSVNPTAATPLGRLSLRRPTLLECCPSAGAGRLLSWLLVCTGCVGGSPRRACLPAARRGRLRPDAVGGPYPVPPSGLPGAPPRISASPGATAGSANSAMPAATAGGLGSTPAGAAPPVAAMKQLLGSPSPATRSASTPSCGRRATCQRGCARWRSARVAASVCLAACLSVRQWVCVSTRPSDCSRPWVSI